jgi:hypothetical protein
MEPIKFIIYATTGGGLGVFTLTLCHVIAMEEDKCLLKSTSKAMNNLPQKHKPIRSGIRAHPACMVAQYTPCNL